MSKRKGPGIDVDRLGSWYQAPKHRKTDAVDRVTAIMAPRSGVTGSQARDQVMQRTLKDAPKVGNRLFTRRKQNIQKKEIEDGTDGSFSVIGGEGVSKVHRLMPHESNKIPNSKGNGMVYPIPDMKMQPELANLFAMAQGSSPLDKTHKESLSNLQVHHSNLIKNFKKQRKLPGLNPRRKITKGGRTFVSLRNILVTPEAAP